MYFIYDLHTKRTCASGTLAECRAQLVGVGGFGIASDACGEIRPLASKVWDGYRLAARLHKLLPTSAGRLKHISLHRNNPYQY